jgi:hypothetical protein
MQRLAGAASLHAKALIELQNRSAKNANGRDQRGHDTVKGCTAAEVELDG